MFSLKFFQSNTRSHINAIKTIFFRSFDSFFVPLNIFFIFLNLNRNYECAIKKAAEGEFPQQQNMRRVCLYPRISSDKNTDQNKDQQQLTQKKQGMKP